MSCKTISTKLPKSVINKLVKCDGVVPGKDSEVNVIEIVNSIGQEFTKKLSNVRRLRLRLACWIIGLL